MTLNLNDPCKIEDTSWIKPVKYVGVCGNDRKKLVVVHKMIFLRYNLGITDYTKAKPNERIGAAHENAQKTPTTFFVTVGELQHPKILMY
jgi:alpha-glucosidase